MSCKNVFKWVNVKIPCSVKSNLLSPNTPPPPPLSGSHYCERSWKKVVVTYCDSWNAAHDLTFTLQQPKCMCKQNNWFQLALHPLQLQRWVQPHKEHYLHEKIHIFSEAWLSITSHKKLHSAAICRRSPFSSRERWWLGNSVCLTDQSVTCPASPKSLMKKKNTTQ